MEGTESSSEVLVVGAGPVGLFAAALLAGRGLAVTVVDEHEPSAAQSFALALHPASLECLAELGIADELISRGTALSRVAFFGDGRRLGELRFDALPTRYPFLLMLPQAELETTLLRHLAAKGGEVRWLHRLVGLAAHSGGDAVAGTIETLAADHYGYAAEARPCAVGEAVSHRAAFVLGADGYASRVRRELQAGFDSVGPPRLFAVFEFSAPHAALKEVRIIVDELAGVLWPLGAERYRVSFELSAGEAFPVERDRQQLLHLPRYGGLAVLDKSELERLILARAPWLEGTVSEVSWSVAVRFEQRLASSLGRGRIFLLGDAAHLMAPVGVQSMNLGIQEARALAHRLEAVLREGASPDTVEAQATTWHAHLRAWMAAPHPLVAEPHAPAWVRMRVAQLASLLPATGAHLPALLGQLGLRLAASLPSMPEI
jgi:2-polyprenyl-6-methoxyphenol hydroxylase-like FAD-dependent oxidoreductase